MAAKLVFQVEGFEGKGFQRTSGTMNYVAALVVDSKGAPGVYSWHQSMAAAYKASRGTYITRSYRDDIKVVPVEVIKVVGQNSGEYGNYEEIREALAAGHRVRLMDDGQSIDVIEAVDAPEQAAPAAIPATDKVCQCGCGQAVKGRFRPGHDARFASQVGKGAVFNAADTRDLAAINTAILQAMEGHSIQLIGKAQRIARREAERLEANLRKLGVHRDPLPE